MTRTLRPFIFALVALLVVATHVRAQAPTRVERLDAALDALIAPDATLELLATGFSWAEGPVWRKAHNDLLFSDVPRNTIYRWQPGIGITPFLRPAGFTGPNPPGRELGSNGLTLDLNGAVVMADHGNRQIARLNDTLFTKVTLADRINGKRFNSPNDLVYATNGDVFFTDPPFGLKGLNDDPAKELTVNGVYRLTPSGTLSLLTDDLRFPNGIALSPDERTLYVSNADARRAIWMAYDLAANGTLSRPRVFFDATSLAQSGRRGVPDGMRVDMNGNVFATGPGGVLIFSPQGKHLGTIVTGQPTANCAFGDDGSMLYITANDRLFRVRLRTNGVVR